MSYEYVRTQNLDISGESGYWASLGRRVSYTYRFVLKEYYDAAENKSRLCLASAKLKVDLNDSVAIWGKILLNGTVLGHYGGVGITTPYNSFAAYAQGNDGITVRHDAEGAAPPVTVSFAQAAGQPSWIGSNFGFSPASGVLVGFPTGTTRSVPLTAHARGSSIASCPAAAATLSQLSLSVERSSPAYCHRAVFSSGGTQLYLSEPFASTLRFTVPRSWFDSFPSAVSLPVTVSVQTYTDSGCSVPVGSAATASLTVTADGGMKPALSSGWATASPYNTGSAAASVNGYVKGFSRAQISFHPNKITMANGASAASYSVSCQGATDSASPYRTPVLTAASAQIVCKVTDSRGRSASETLTVSVMDYARPKLSGISLFRCRADGTADEDGTYYKVKAAVGFSPLGGANSCSLDCAIAQTGGSYGQSTALTSGEYKTLGPISLDKSYTVRICAADSLGGNAVYYAAIPTRKWAMKFRADGLGVAFGKAAETDRALEIPGDWSFLRGGTPMQSGAVFLADANTAGGFVGQLSLFRWDGSSLNTPYSEGAAVFSQGFIVESVATGGAKTQLAFPAGQARLFIRRYYAGAWTAWDRLASASELPSVPRVQSGTVYAAVSSNANCSTSVSFPTAFSAPPSVTVNYAGSLSSAATLAALGWSVRSVTETGFELLVGIAASVSFSSALFRWQAIGS